MNQNSDLPHGRSRWSALRRFVRFTRVLMRRRDRCQTVVDLCDPVRGALRDAQVLLAFAAQSRRELKKDKIEALNQAIAAVAAARSSSTPPSANELSAFWCAYDGLAVDSAPLSAQSIRESMAFAAKRFPWSVFTATGINAFIAIGVFFVCIALQGFWGAGQELLSKADALDTKKLEVLQRIQPKNSSYPGAASAGGGVGSTDWAMIWRQM